MVDGPIVGPKFMFGGGLGRVKILEHIVTIMATEKTRNYIVKPLKRRN